MTNATKSSSRLTICRRVDHRRYTMYRDLPTHSLTAYTCSCHAIDMSDDSADETHDDPAPPTAEVTVKGPGISITRPVEEATMSSIIALLFGAAPAAPAARGGEGGGGGGQEGARRQGGRTQQSSEWDEDLTLGEFIVDTGAKTFQQKICAAGYYLIKFQNAASFNRDDVRTALADAHEDMPGNFGRDFGSAASSHLIAAKQGEGGQFIIPRTGRAAVESHFQDVPKRRTARRTTKKASSNSNGDAE